uniref:PIN domain-containing protein n=1 Tax=Candidatus Kentrum sp. MB TaxID=2138164 RepID=A0A450XMS5_9GAMM|nr:MAG: hypothetical protein BECKMB1821G_GA0114241_100751 [Candidatus Kentron sp. MB]VFK30556.1 MAG: hypothetical protein BECKMB1821I_GA0114274_101633 [Candidatus Kentron sp. MB]VFK75300.1 MAG: hypothetical protein BECKMB1821H_GA0114242_101932 [Candidatus Kentron sp. MB]
MIDEASEGNPDAAQRRLHVLTDIPHLSIPEPVTDLATVLLAEGALPKKAADDALHVAVCAYHGIDYLLTWNCHHLSNAEMKPIMRRICALQDYTCPEICVPLELTGETNDR